MLTATLVFFTAVQGSPVERFSSFIKKTDQLTMKASVNFRGVPLKLTFINEPGIYQYCEIKGAVDGERFWQIPDRILAVSDTDGQYWEYRGIEQKSPPPPEVGTCMTLYPGFLHDLAMPDGLKGLQLDEPLKIGDRTYETVSKSVAKELSQYKIKIAIDEFGIPQQFHMTEQTDAGPTLTIYEVSSMSTNPTQLRSWKYQPPVGYMPGEIPYTARPLASGTKINLGRWTKAEGGQLDVADQNRKGVVILFTADDCEPSKRAAGAFEKLKKALDAEGQKLIEVRLGKDANKLKRSWSVVSDSDGKLEKYFRPPVTPYLYVIRKDAIMLGGWAGYAADQDKAMVDSVIGRFKKHALPN